MKTKIIPVVFTLIFFMASFLTLSHYGISWDETLHFYRGQAYLHYFLTGKQTYDGMQQINLQGTQGDPSKITISRRSFYQSDAYNGEFMLQNDSGHPPLNGELAALSNYIFFQKLGILDDVTSHHLFNVLSSTLLVFVVVSFAVETMGILAGSVSFLALVTYPIFWAESHFNIKDPPEAAFFSACIWAFWKSLQKGNLYWLFLSFIFFAAALGTKFNVLFLPAIILPYLILRYKDNLKSPLKTIRIFPKKYLLVTFVGMIVAGAIFIGSWPYLWQNFYPNMSHIFGYYKEIGINLRYQPDYFFIRGFNIFPILWILFTTPPIVLILSGIGIVAVFIKWAKFRIVGILWLLWFLIPIIRVTLPNTTIYGGIRQIMEFLPAMSLLAGLGAWQIAQWIKNKHKNNNFAFTVKLIIIASFIWPLFVLIKLHPNENVYFNFLIGGLRGAKERNFPSWGNTFGNAYLQGIKWINENAERNSKLSLIQGTATNAPAIFLRKDIDYKSGNWSGIERGGEYLMELTFNDSTRDFNYAWDYVENFLDPLYELRADGVPILKIWKNKLEHTRKTARRNEIKFLGSLAVETIDNQIILDFGRKVFLSRLYLYFDSLSGCLMPKGSLVELSKDGLNWVTEKDPIPFRQIKQEQNIGLEKIEYFIAGKETKYAKFVFEKANACPLNIKSVDALVLD